jgi:dipeptidyl-peptidase-4
MAWNRYMVRHGYLVLAVDVRGSGGYGHLFEEYIHYRFGAQETVDLREVVSFLRRQTYADADRLGIWGCDYGGHTVVHAMLEFSDGFKAGFADAPITEWGSYDAYFTERYLGLPGKRITEYQDSSALEHANDMTGELLVASSAHNLEIRPAHQAALEEAMNEAKPAAVGKRFHVLNLEGADYRTNAARLSGLMAAMTEFFEHHL